MLRSKRRTCALTDPRVSIVTIVRNDIEGLTRTVASAQAQKHNSWELLIKDGQSTDGTAEFSEKLTATDERIRLIRGHDINLYDAMNIAYHQASGEFLIFLNAGDTFHDDAALSRALDEMETSKQPVDIGFFATLVKMENGHSYVRAAYTPQYIRYGQPAIHQSTLIRVGLHIAFPYDHVAYPNIADYVAIAQMIRNDARAKSFKSHLATFEITSQSHSFVNQREARREFDHAIAEIWQAGRLTRLRCRTRRWLSMFVVRMLMR